MTRRQTAENRLTRGFIAARPHTVVLVPYARVRTPEGGWEWVEGQPRAPQEIALIPATETVAAGSFGRTISVDGQVAVATFVLVGDYNAAIEIGDLFYANGGRHRVVHKLPTNGYEQRAVAVRHGD